MTGGSVCYITGGMVSGKSSHKKCRSAKCSHYPPNFQTKLFFSPPWTPAIIFPVAIFDDRRVYHMFRYVQGRAGRYIETMWKGFQRFVFQMKAFLWLPPVPGGSALRCHTGSGFRRILNIFSFGAVFNSIHIGFQIAETDIDTNDTTDSF